jgi:AcrR family transcriptional regulator
MPLLLNADHRTDVLVRAVNDVLIDHGPAGLTLRRIGRVSGVSPASILHHLGSREHLLRVAAGRTSQCRLQELQAGSWDDGALAFLPRSGDEILEARAWLAWLELWRSEEFLERTLANARYDELSLLASVTGHQLTRPQLDTAAALVDGLLVAVCSPVSPMRLEVARQILRDHLGACADVTPEQAYVSSPARPRPGR